MSTLDIILAIALVSLFGVVGYLIFRMKKLSLNYYSKSVSHTVEQQSNKIVELEQQIKLYKREDTGVIASWAEPREDKAAYLLTVYNDTADRIFNIQVTTEAIYQDHIGLYSKKTKCDSRESINVFFMPGGWNNSASEPATDRSRFIEIWLENKLPPIKFTLTYTETPARSNYKTVEIDFTTQNLSSHLQRRLKALKSRPTLRSISSSKFSEE